MDKLSCKFDKQAKHFEQTTIKTIENTKKYLNVNDIVLDYGCATGIITYEIADNVKEIHGIDISSKMIEAAKRKAGEQKTENIDFVQATVFNERYRRESFDVILAFSIMHFVEDKQKVMQRINELLKPGGLIISSTPCLGERKTFLSSLLFLLAFTLTKVGIVPHMRFFKISELEDLITDGKFQIVKTESLNHNPEEYFIVAKKVLRTQQAIAPDALQ